MYQHVKLQLAEILRNPVTLCWLKLKLSIECCGNKMGWEGDGCFVATNSFFLPVPILIRSRVRWPDEIYEPKKNYRAKCKNRCCISGEIQIQIKSTKSDKQVSQ